MLACGGRMKRIAALTERAGIVRILEHLGVSTGGAADAPLARRSLMGWDMEPGGEGVVCCVQPDDGSGACSGGPGALDSVTELPTELAGSSARRPVNPRISHIGCSVTWS